MAVSSTIRIDVDLKQKGVKPAQGEMRGLAKAVGELYKEETRLAAAYKRQQAVVGRTRGIYDALGKAERKNKEGLAKYSAELDKHQKKQLSLGQQVLKLKSDRVAYVAVIRKEKAETAKLREEASKLAKASAKVDRAQKKQLQTTDRLARGQKRAATTQNRLNRSRAKGIRLGKDVLVVLSRWRNRILLVTFAIGGLITTLKESIEETVRQEAAMRGLLSVGEKVGASFGALKATAQELVKDGLMTIGDAAGSLKNLLAAGFSLPEATNLMIAFKDAAAFGRQGSLSFGEAIRGASEGIKNQNSILVDNVGITKNLSIILKEAGYSMQDLAKVSSDVNVRMALYKGLMKEAALFSGDAARVTETLTGQFALLQSTSRKTSKEIGDKLYPVIQSVTEALIALNLRIRAIGKNQDVIDSMKQLGEILIVILKLFGSFLGILSRHTGLLKLALSVLAVNIAFKGMQKGLKALIAIYKKLGAAIVMFIPFFRLLGRLTMRLVAHKSSLGRIVKLVGMTFAKFHPIVLLIVGALTLLIGLLVKLKVFSKEAADEIRDYASEQIKSINIELEAVAAKEAQILKLKAIAEKYEFGAKRIDRYNVALERLIATSEKLTFRKIDLEAEKAFQASTLPGSFFHRPFRDLTTSEALGKPAELSGQIDKIMERLEYYRGDVRTRAGSKMEGFREELKALTGVDFAGEAVFEHYKELLGPRASRLDIETRWLEDLIAQLKIITAFRPEAPPPPPAAKRIAPPSGVSRFFLGKTPGLGAEFEGSLELEKKWRQQFKARLDLYQKERALKRQQKIDDAETDAQKERLLVIIKRFDAETEKGVIKIDKAYQSLNDTFKDLNVEGIIAMKDLTDSQAGALRAAQQLGRVLPKAGLAAEEALLADRLAYQKRTGKAVSTRDKGLERLARREAAGEKTAEQKLEVYRNYYETLDQLDIDFKARTAERTEDWTRQYQDWMTMNLNIYVSLVDSAFNSIETAADQIMVHLLDTGTKIEGLFTHIVGNMALAVGRMIQSTMRQIAVARVQAAALRAEKEGTSFGLGGAFTALGGLSTILPAGGILLGIGLLSSFLANRNKESAPSRVEAQTGGTGGLRAGAAGGTIAAQNVNYYINPSIIFSNQGDVLVGSMGVSELGSRLGALQVQSVKEAIETGELSLQGG